MEALFYDVQVVDANAPSYDNFTSEQVIDDAKKGRQPFFVADERRHAYTRLVISVDGISVIKFQTLIQAVSEKLSQKWHKACSLVVANWTKVRQDFSNLRTTRLTRKRW